MGKAASHYRGCVSRPLSRWGDLMIEDPVHLLGRLRLGREEYCQRLLTMLILAGPYPRWNSRHRPSERGTRFLQALNALSLKTERASHRPAQVTGYFELAAYHYPGCRIDLTYLTPSMPLAPPPVPAGMRFAHITWDQVMPLVAETWGDGDPQARRVTAMLLAALESIGDTWTIRRAEQLVDKHPATPEPLASLADRSGMLETALPLRRPPPKTASNARWTILLRTWRTCSSSVSLYAR